MNQDIYVVIEHLQGQVADISYVMLAAARELTQSTGGQVVGVFLGKDAQGLASNLAADKVLYANHPALAEFTADAYQKTVAGLIGENEPRQFSLGTPPSAQTSPAYSRHVCPFHLSVPVSASLTGNSPARSAVARSWPKVRWQRPPR